MNTPIIPSINAMVPSVAYINFIVSLKNYGHEDTKKIYSIKRAIISKSYSKIAHVGLKCAINCAILFNISNFAAEN